jgi:hypothetical protein
MRDSATFYTVSDAPFFAGTVALVNSLRITRNGGDVVILDHGLAADQRKRLERHATVVTIDGRHAAGAYVYKAFPHLLGARGLAVLIDSDMIVTRALDELLRAAADGRICVFADAIPHRERWFAEWHDVLELRAPLRRQMYFNSGFVALSIGHWPDFLARWWDLCARIPPEEVFADVAQPFWAADQDALSALLASEIPFDAVEVLPEYAQAYPDEQLRAKVDVRTLRCTLDGRPVAILHHSLGPKVWAPRGWIRLRLDAYVRLLPRLLFADDVPIRLRFDEVPFWLRPNVQGRVAARTLDAAHGSLRRAVHASPDLIRRRLLALRNHVVVSRGRRSLSPRAEPLGRACPGSRRRA